MGKGKGGGFSGIKWEAGYFLFFLICIFFFLFRFCCYLWNQAVGLVYLSVCFVPVEIHESFFFLAPTWSAHSAQRKAAQMAANRLHLEERKSKFATFQNKKKPAFLTFPFPLFASINILFFFFCLLFGLHSSAFCASSILSCFIKGVLARTRKPRLLSAPAHRLSHCRYQDVIQGCRAKKKTNQKKNKKKWNCNLTFVRPRCLWWGTVSLLRTASGSW